MITPVSVLVPTLNEAADLPGWLERLASTGGVAIVDSGSTHATALERGVRRSHLWLAPAGRVGSPFP